MDTPIPQIPDAFISLINEKAQKRIAELETENARLQEAKRAAMAIADQKSIENVGLRAALKPFADCVYNDNGDMTIDRSTVDHDDFVRAYHVLRAHEQGVPTDQVVGGTRYGYDDRVEQGVATVPQTYSIDSTPARELSIHQLASELARLEKNWDDMRANLDGMSGSPGEWMAERMDELRAEQKRREALPF